MSNSEEYLPLSGLQHFVMCKRQWALIHIERQWHENLLTAEGRIQHEIAHDEDRSESRGNVLITHGMRVASNALRLQGSCDVVEFHRDASGINISGREGRWRVFPIEYKHGEPGVGTTADTIQLCCQAMCLEEMLLCDVPSGCIFYHETRRREKISMDSALREQALAMAKQMNEYFKRGYTPRVKQHAGCNRCSLKEICLPKIQKTNDVAAYIHNAVEEVKAL